MNVLDLFSGIGGFSLGLEKSGMNTVAFCERDKRCWPILEKNWPNVPIFDDVSTLTNEALHDAGIGTIDVICGGFPCQDISAAWDGPGLAGKRSGLWFEYARIIGEVQPRYVIIENVANLRKRGLGVVLQDLACMGFDADWTIIPAAAVGAPHQRDRLWIVAKRRWEPVVFSAECVDEDTGDESFCRHCREDFGECDCFGPSSADDAGWECVEEDWGFVAYPDGAGRGEQLWPVSILPEQLPAECYRWYRHEPAVGRVFNGFSAWLDGNKLTLESHERIMEYVIQQGDGNADAAQGRSKEALSILRDSLRKEEGKWQAGRLRCVSAEEVLLTYLRKLQEGTSLRNNIQPKGAEVPETGMRGMRAGDEFTCPPHRPGQDEQPQWEHTDIVQALSRLLAHDSQAAWSRYSRENAYPAGFGGGLARTVVDGFPGRSYRIQKLGNSVVPFIPWMIGCAINHQPERDGK